MEGVALYEDGVALYLYVSLICVDTITRDDANKVCHKVIFKIVYD